jgi:hypothetical protein
MVIGYHLIWTLYGWSLPIERVARSIRDNPVKVGRPVQEWPFVTTYDGWLPRPARET